MVNTQDNVRTLVVAESAVPELEKAVKRLARTARRLGLTPEPRLELDWSRREDCQHARVVTTDPDDGARDSRTPAVISVVPAHLHLPDTGLIQATGGWRVLGSLTKTDEGLEVNALAAAHLPLITPYRDQNRME